MISLIIRTRHLNESIVLSNDPELNKLIAIAWCRRKSAREHLNYMFQSTITDGGCNFPSNASRSKIFKKANGCLLKDRRKAGGRLVYCSKISHHLYSAIFN